MSQPSFRRLPPSTLDCDGAAGVDRRNFLKTGVFTFLGLSLLEMLKLDALAGGSETARCDAVILVWLAGGPSHIDTFDPKPGQPTGGPFRALASSADGIQLCEHLPKLAGQMKHAALIRSLTNKEGSHDRATYELHTGYKPLGSILHPSLGSLVVQQKGRRNEDLPAYVSIGQEAYGAGFLGSQAAPFYIGNPANPTQNLVQHGSVDKARFARRIDTLQQVERPAGETQREAPLLEQDGYYRDAVKMMYAESVKAFDLSQEKELYRKGYGENNLGRGLLMARRLVEQGVRFVEVSMGGWDTHNDNFTAIQNNCGTLDPALASLLEDLAARGLLKRTLVLCTGEFGRTPKINAGSGRDHFPRVWSALLAGGGVKAGYVHGASNELGSEIKDHPVLPGQLHATLFELLGIDYTKENYTDQGRPIRIVEKAEPVRDLIA